MFLLYGFGKSLRSLACHLKQKQISFVVCDDSENQLREASSLGYEIITPVHFLTNPDKTIHLVVAPGIRLTNPLVIWAKANDVRIDNDISLFLKDARKDNILVTGTFGKSTCVSLIHHVYRSLGKEMQLGGNIGIPVFDLAPDKISVIELSAQQLDLCLHPYSSVAVVLNLHQQHLDWYGDETSYYLSKLKLLKNASISIFSHEKVNFILKHVPDCAEYKTISIKDRRADFSLINGVLHEGEEIVANRFHTASEISSLVAYAALRCLGFAPQEIIPFLENYKGLEHRCEVVFDHPDLPTIINDSKSTNLSNTMYAIEKYCGSDLVCIIGGKDTPQDINQLSAVDQVKLFITTGSNGQKLHDALQSLGLNSVHEPNLSECIRIGLKNCGDAGTLLFSPGYPSTDQYKDFEDRGNKFKEQLKLLLNRAE